MQPETGIRHVAQFCQLPEESMPPRNSNKQRQITLLILGQAKESGQRLTEHIHSIDARERNQFWFQVRQSELVVAGPAAVAFKLREIAGTVLQEDGIMHWCRQFFPASNRKLDTVAIRLCAHPQIEIA